MQKALPDDKEFLTPAEAVDYFWLSRRKFSEWIQKENSKDTTQRNRQSSKIKKGVL